MINQEELELLIDIQKLIKKYGEETFLSLSDNLKNEDFIRSIELLGKSAPTIKEASRNTKIKVNYEDKLNDILSSLRKNENTKYKLLSELIDKLNNKHYFNTLKQFSSYLNEAGLHRSKITTWIHGKYILVSYLSEKNISYIKSSIEYLDDQQNGTERSLDAWSDIILNEDKRANK